MHSLTVEYLEESTQTVTLRGKDDLDTLMEMLEDKNRLSVHSSNLPDAHSGNKGNNTCHHAGYLSFKCTNFKKLPDELVV